MSDPDSILTDYKAQQEAAVRTLLAWSGNSATQLARAAKVSTRNVYVWIAQGRVSVKAAAYLHSVPGCPLTKEQMRPDIRVWPTQTSAAE